MINKDYILTRTENNVSSIDYDILSMKTLSKFYCLLCSKLVSKTNLE